MKLSLCLAVLSLASCAAVQTKTPVPGGNAPEPRGNRVSLYLGQRDLDEDDWSPVDEQPMAGLELVHEAPGSSVGWEVGLMASSDDDTVGGVDVDVTTSELYGGVHKTFGEDVLRPYLGAGLAVIKLKVDASGAGEDDDTSAALYAHGGLAIFATDVVSLALDLRFLLGSDMRIGGANTDADYGQLAFVVGVGF